MLWSDTTQSVYLTSKHIQFWWTQSWSIANINNTGHAQVAEYLRFMDVHRIKDVHRLIDAPSINLWTPDYKSMDVHKPMDVHQSKVLRDLMPSTTKLIWLICIQGFPYSDLLKWSDHIVSSAAKTVHKLVVGSVYIEIKRAMSQWLSVFFSTVKSVIKRHLN